MSALGEFVIDALGLWRYLCVGPALPAWCTAPCSSSAQRPSSSWLSSWSGSSRRRGHHSNPRRVRGKLLTTFVVSPASIGTSRSRRRPGGGERGHRISTSGSPPIGAAIKPPSSETGRHRASPQTRARPATETAPYRMQGSSGHAIGMSGPSHRARHVAGGVVLSQSPPGP